jgi:hypothetical protein
VFIKFYHTQPNTQVTVSVIEIRGLLTAAVLHIVETTMQVLAGSNEAAVRAKHRPNLSEPAPKRLRARQHSIGLWPPKPNKKKT